MYTKLVLNCIFKLYYTFQIDYLSNVLHSFKQSLFEGASIQNREIRKIKPIILS